MPSASREIRTDGLVVVQNESAYKNVVDEAGNGELLRRTFVDRAGHYAFTPAETITAAQTSGLDPTFLGRHRVSFLFRQGILNLIQASIFAHLMHSLENANSDSGAATHP